MAASFCINAILGDGCENNANAALTSFAGSQITVSPTPEEGQFVKYSIIGLKSYLLFLFLNNKVWLIAKCCCLKNRELKQPRSLAFLFLLYYRKGNHIGL